MRLLPAARVFTLLSFALLFLGAAPLYAVWPMPQYNSYPTCTGTTPTENCSQQPGSIEMHRQVKMSERSVRFPATYSCTPVSGQFGGFCDGPGCTSEAGFCRQPAILGVPTYEIQTMSTGAFVRFHLEYDFPGNYCQLSPDGNVAEWPIVFNNLHLDRLQVLDADSGNILAESMAVFEHGQWNPLVNFCGKGKFLLRALNECAGLNQTVAVPIDAATIPSVALTPCGGDRNCFFCSLTNGGPTPPGPSGNPINNGSGDVTVSVPLFTIAQSPMSLSFSLMYHSELAGNQAMVNEPMGRGWTHSFNESLRRIDRFTNELYRLRADGSESWYTQANNTTWISARPGELRESVTLTNGQLQVKDLDGTITAFDDASGAWLSTADRWGNTISGSYTNSLLTTLTDSEGRRLQLAYAGTQLTQITLPEGSSWRFAYAGGGLAQIFDPIHAGATAWRTFEYQADTRGTQRLLTAMRDEAGALLEGHAYDSLERGISSYSGATRELVTVQYSGSTPTQALVTSSIDGAMSQTATFSLIYQRGRYLPLEVNGNCASCGGGDDDEKFQYDQNNFPTQKIDGDGHITNYNYDGNGNLLTKIEAAGTPRERTTTYAYAYAQWPRFMTQMTEQAAARTGLKTTSHRWNSGGVGETTLTTSVAGFLRASDSTATTYTTTSTFDAHHRLLTIVGPRTDLIQTTSRTYFPDADTNFNRRGRLASVTNEVGLISTFDRYDQYGIAGLSTDPNGVQMVVQTDARGRVISSGNKAFAGDPRESSDYMTASTYDGRDRLVRHTRPRGNVMAFGYEDGTNRLTDAIRLDANGNEAERRHWTLNAIGDKVREEDQQCVAPAARCSSWLTRRQEDFAYDAHNRLSQVVHAVPTGSTIRYSYDGAGLLHSVQDENHSTPSAIYGYDELNRLTSVQQTLNASAIHTSYDYDAEDNLTSVTDPNGNTTKYAYDDFHRMQTQTSPVTGTTSYTYDAAGNLTASTDANGATTTRTYDAANRLLAATSTSSSASSESIRYTYDDPTAGNYGKGRLASVSDPTGSMSYAYERRGMVRAEGHTVQGSAYSLAYGYDANGNRTSMTYPSNRVVNYTFDSADRPFSATSNGTTLIGGASYLPFGPETQITFGNGTTRTSSYDLRYRPVENRLTGNSGVVAGYGYGEDAAGNIISIHDLVDPTFNRDFGYDDLNRLTTAISGGSLWGTGSYRYDSMGNMLSLSLGNARQSTFAYNGALPKLTGVTENGSTRQVAYDAAGNELTVGAGTFGYSPRNLLAVGDGLSYTYDARGLRTVTTVAAALGTFNGNVVTATNGTPVAGAVVTIDGTLNSTTTDANGNFSLNQPSGNFTLTVVKIGFLPETTTAFTLTSGANVSVGAVRLSVAPSTIRGTLVSSLGGSVAGATIALNNTTAAAATDSRGNFSVIIPAGTFTATITAGGYTPHTTASFTTRPGQDYSLGAITLAAIPATVTGTVISSTGGAVAGATMTADGGPTGASRNGRVIATANGTSTTTDANGNFTLSLAAGTYTLAISKGGFGTATTGAFAIGAGSAFSLGSLVIDPLGTITGQVVAQATASPVGNATVALPGSVNSVSTDPSGRFSIQQPPGTYAIHVSATGYADVSTPFFTLAPGVTYDAGRIQLPAVALAVFVGYADDLRASANFPVPWAGAPNVVYIGSSSPIDAGAIRLDNNTDNPMPVDNVTADLGRPGPAFSLWGSFTVPSHGSVILTQTAQFNFDTSDFPIAQCGQPIVAGDPRVPRVVVKVNGTSTTYFDTGHILDTGGFDLACNGNESLQWRLIGTTGINANGDFLLGPPTGTGQLGQPYTVTASVTDGTAQPVPNVTVTFKVIAGPNLDTSGNGVTDSTGAAKFSYPSHTAGTDTLQATITNASGGRSTSNPVTVTWPALGNIAVFVGYADDLRAASAFPNPWRGSPGVIYIGSNSPIDAGALRIDNTSDQPALVDSVSVDLQHPGPTFNLWGSFTIPAHGSAILTQTTQYNFDTSDFSYQPCLVPAPPTDPRIPKITVTVAGQSASYLDTGHILDTFGFDIGLNCASDNESLQWRPVGSSSTARAGNLTLRPLASVSALGASYTAIAIATDAGNEPVAAVPIDFRIVAGPNSGQTGRATTDANGIATFSYSSAVAGTDTIRASATNSSGGVVTANGVSSTWVSALTVQLSPSSMTLSIGSPYNAIAVLTDGGGSPLANVVVTFRVTAGPNAGKIGKAVTDTTGHAGFAYVSANAGADSLVASVVGAGGTSILSNQVTASWVAPLAIALAPSSSSNPLDSNFTATAFVSSGGSPSSSAPVMFSVVAGPNAGRTFSATTDGTGHAVFTFKSTATGTDIVQAAAGSVTSNQIVAKWVAIPTVLTYSGAFAGGFNDPMTLSARLTEAASGHAVGGQALAFNFGGQTMNAATDSSGTASVTVTPKMTPGVVPLSVSFAAAGSYTGTALSLFINVVRDESAIRFTGKAVVGNGMPQMLTAVLTDADGGQPLVGRAVAFTIGSISATATTDANGVASTSLTVPPTLGTGPIRLSATFDGDGYNIAASTSVPVIVYEPESFVIWGGNAVPPRVGDRVNFWGAQWDKQVTGGDYHGTGSFKGWATRPAGSPLLPCEPAAHASGACWSSKGGQSFPPAVLERYISVIVATSIDKVKGDVAGNIAAVVAVRVDPVPVYGNNPGKPGYGVIVGVIEDGAKIFSSSASHTAASYFFRHITRPRPPQIVSLVTPDLEDLPVKTEWMAMTSILHPAPLSVASGNRRYSFYSPEMNLMAETALAPSGAPAIAYEYVWFNGHPVAQIDTATAAVHWTFTDHLGTPIVLTNADGSIYWRAEYEPYGAVFALRSPDVHQPLRLPGQEVEQINLGANGVTEREYNIFRWYRAAWGRYTQADPLGLRGDPLQLRFADLRGLTAPLPIYLYTEDDPISQLDPFGLVIKRCFRELRSKKSRAFAALGSDVGWGVVQPPVPGVSKCLMHEFLYDTNTGESQGYDPDENVKETMRGAICYDIPEPLGRCVWSNFEKIAGKPEAYDLTRHNCQITINQTVTYCKCKGFGKK